MYINNLFETIFELMKLGKTVKNYKNNYFIVIMKFNKIMCLKIMESERVQ